MWKRAIFLFGLLAVMTIQLYAKASFTFLEHNSNWYRTFDSTSVLLEYKGQLLFSWIFEDQNQVADSFYVGIDTLWMLPQNVLGDTANDWDLQVCPEGFCIQGLKEAERCVCFGKPGTACPAGFCTTDGEKISGFGGNAPTPFGNFIYDNEHHFQFYPAFNQSFRNAAPEKSIFGGFMYGRSRTTGVADTVLGFGAWNLVWDEKHLPPVRPVNGYLPKRSNFVITGDTVRYVSENQNSIPVQTFRSFSSGNFTFYSPFSQNQGEIFFGYLKQGQELFIYDISGHLIWNSGRVNSFSERISWDGRDQLGRESLPGIYLIELLSNNNKEIIKIPKLR